MKVFSNKFDKNFNLSEFFNKNDEKADFEKRFSFFYDYAGSAQLIGSQKSIAIKEIYDRITQDIINASLANW